ncbi:hypothetical protein KAR91_74060 [Candidatus Pacearchaeota archaeon]|nr:hypothetical protein [Candidatus Pacearchaeota archaeon]
MKVFLGGTCNGSNWRNILIPMLEIDYYNPVVPDWTPECMGEELRQRELCDFCLYSITPKMTGVYSIAEVVDDSNKRPEKTILILMKDDGNKKFDEHQMKSLTSVRKMVEENGGRFFESLRACSLWLNTQ